MSTYEDNYPPYRLPIVITDEFPLPDGDSTYRLWVQRRDLANASLLAVEHVEEYTGLNFQFSMGDGPNDFYMTVAKVEDHGGDVYLSYIIEGSGNIGMSSIFSDYEWHSVHVVVSTSPRIYIDGVEISGLTFDTYTYDFDYEPVEWELPANESGLSIYGKILDPNFPSNALNLAHFSLKGRAFSDWEVGFDNHHVVWDKDYSPFALWAEGVGGLQTYLPLQDISYDKDETVNLGSNGRTFTLSGTRTPFDMWGNGSGPVERDINSLHRDQGLTGTLMTANSDIPLMTDFTVGIWYRRPELWDAPNGDHFYLGQIGFATDVPGWSLIARNDGGVSFVYDYDRWGFITSSIPLDEWVWIVGVVKANESLELYINGILVASDYSGASSHTAGQNKPLDIVSFGSNTDKHVYDIAHIMMWDHALSASDIHNGYLAAIGQEEITEYIDIVDDILLTNYLIKIDETVLDDEDQISWGDYIIPDMWDYFYVIDDLAEGVIFRGSSAADLINLTSSVTILADFLTQASDLLNVSHAPVMVADYITSASDSYSITDFADVMFRWDVSDLIPLISESTNIDFITPVIEQVIDEAPVTTLQLVEVDDVPLTISESLIFSTASIITEVIFTGVMTDGLTPGMEDYDNIDDVHVVFGWPTEWAQPSVDFVNESSDSLSISDLGTIELAIEIAELLSVTAQQAQVMLSVPLLAWVYLSDRVKKVLSVSGGSTIDSILWSDSAFGEIGRSGEETDGFTFDDSAVGDIIRGTTAYQWFTIVDKAIARNDALSSSADNITIIDDSVADDYIRIEDAILLSDTAQVENHVVVSVNQNIFIIPLGAFGRLGKFVEVVNPEFQIDNGWGSNVEIL